MAWRGDPNNKVPNIGNAHGDYSNVVVQKSDVLSDVKVEVNRALETRRDTDKQKDITVSFLDVDNAVHRQLEKFQLTVPDNGQIIKVPVFYASPEKWKSIKVDGFMRDYQGKIILPAVVFSRTSSEKNRNMMLFNRYLKYTVMKQYDDKNRYTPFNVLLGQNVPINDVYGIVMPDHMIMTYHFIVWTEYREQANKITERLNFEAEDFWGEKRGYRFQVKIDSISHTTQLQANQDRMVKDEFDMQVFAYLLPDVIDKFEGKQNTTQKWFTPKKVIIASETVVGHVTTEREVNAEKWRNQNYPNVPKDKVIPTPSILFVDVSEIPVGTTPLSIWTSPAPQNSSDPGIYGQISQDDEYYYLYTTVWKRAPKVLVNDISILAGEKKWLSFDNDYIYILGDLNRLPMSLFNTF